MSATEIDLTKLRTPFPAEMVGKLPRVTCGDCSDRRKECGKHNKLKCGICQAYVSEKHIHIDYVGHADVTSRLLEVDPEWDWDFRSKEVEPGVLAAAAAGGPDVLKAVLDNAPPKFDLDDHGSPVGMWIKLTVGGVTRLGYGSCPSGQGDAVKVLIGDALRNAAMRFGVALDLWAKGDRADPTAENATASAGKAQRGGRQSAADAFETAAPAPARQNGSRPSSQGPRSAGEQSIDHGSQAFADEAHNATDAEAIAGIHERARVAKKLAGNVRNQESGGIGQLALYLNWRRKQLKDAAPARLDPDDQWAVAFKEATDAVEAERLLGDLRRQGAEGKVAAPRAVLIERLAEELFPGLTTTEARAAA